MYHELRVYLNQTMNIILPSYLLCYIVHFILNDILCIAVCIQGRQLF